MSACVIIPELEIEMLALLLNFSDVFLFRRNSTKVSI
jgi:hypothetical protein